MLAHKLQAKIYKRGYLELRNLPFKEGTQIEIVISKKKRKKNLQKLIKSGKLPALPDDSQSLTFPGF